jgi:hypothetical protein
MLKYCRLDWEAGPMKPGLALFIFLAATVAAAAFAVSQGLYIGSSVYRSPYIRDRVWYEKDCSYLFASGIHSRQSGGGATPQAADQNGFCPLFQKQF